ncbi:MAG: MBL fold metallo-hydrolase [Acidimicrobiales bacterium]
MEVISVDASDLGNRSYVVTDGRSAMAIDPPRPARGVLDLLRSRGLVLEIVVETHLHNDHLSGGPELAEATGATHAVCAEERVHGARGLIDGEGFRVGQMLVEVVPTPGHTRHHQAFVVTKGNDCTLFTGGSLLVGAVGRTDLSGADCAEELAGDQWHSVRRLLGNMSRSAVVHPTHGFGSFCSATPCAANETTIGAEREVNPAALLDQQTFVKTLLAGFGEYPSYFAHMADRNRSGLLLRAYLDPVPRLTEEDVSDLRTPTWLIDVRQRADFATGHIPGAVNIGVDGPFATYVGWAMPWENPFALVAAHEDDLSRARAFLAHIGLDTPVGTAIHTFSSRSSAIRRASFAELAVEWTQDVAVIDVRREEEWNGGHVLGAYHLPVHRLIDAELPKGNLWLYCEAGYRAMLGASLLKRMGREVVAIDDVWSSASKAGLPV